MARFRIKTLLIWVAVVAVWFSTFSGYEAAGDVRSFIMVGVMVTSGVAAWAHSGARRAFWTGFCVTLVAASTRNLFSSVGPNFRWLTRVAREVGTGDTLASFVQADKYQGTLVTLAFAEMLIAATIIGLLSAYVYAQCRESNDRP